MPPKEVTTAVRLPRDGAVAKVMVNWVAVALVTVPVPVLRTTVLLAAVVSNPVPAMVRVVALIARPLVLKVTVGAATMVATWTALPLVPPKEVTTAVRLPRDGAVAKVMVNWVAVALVTVPVPVLRTTVLLAAVVSNPVPAMVRVVALMARLLVFKVTVGAIFAVCPMKAMLFKSTPALSAPLFAVMMSSLPSPFTSPKVTVVGPDPVAKLARV